MTFQTATIIEKNNERPTLVSLLPTMVKLFFPYIRVSFQFIKILTKIAYIYVSFLNFKVLSTVFILIILTLLKMRPVKRKGTIIKIFLLIFFLCVKMEWVKYK
jgi:hypothetical protein